MPIRLVSAAGFPWTPAVPVTARVDGASAGAAGADATAGFDLAACSRGIHSAAVVPMPVPTTMATTASRMTCALACIGLNHHGFDEPHGPAVFCRRLVLPVARCTENQRIVGRIHRLHDRHFVDPAGFVDDDVDHLGAVQSLDE